MVPTREVFLCLCVNTRPAKPSALRMRPGVSPNTVSERRRRSYRQERIVTRGFWYPASAGPGSCRTTALMVAFPAVAVMR